MIEKFMRTFLSINLIYFYIHSQTIYTVNENIFIQLRKYVNFVLLLLITLCCYTLNTRGYKEFKLFPHPKVNKQFLHLEILQICNLLLDVYPNRLYI